MGIIVQKFGGTSVADTDRIKAVAKKVLATKEKGNQVVVVVSAPAGTTDRLTKMAKSISETPHAREMDMLLSSGEQISMSLLAMTLYEMGHEAISFNASQVGIYTDQAHTKAKITEIKSEKIQAELDAGKIVIVAGFQGITKDMEITTLGRGGSDTSAVALGVALNADEVEIYTDVNGIYTADPRIAPKAVKIEAISYEEMSELAGSGSKVLHLRSVELAAKYGIKIHLRSSFVDDKGTIVKEEDELMEKAEVRGIAHSKNEAKITIVGVPDKPGIAAKIFGEIAKENINVDIIIQNLGANGKNDISFTFPISDLESAKAKAEELKINLEAEAVISDEKIAKIAVVGVGMRSNSGVAATTFKALAEAGVNIDMISTSEIKIACIIREEDTEKAVNVLHDSFDLDGGKKNYE